MYKNWFEYSRMCWNWCRRLHCLYFALCVNRASYFVLATLVWNQHLLDIMTNQLVSTCCYKTFHTIQSMIFPHYVDLYVYIYTIKEENMFFLCFKYVLWRVIFTSIFVFTSFELYKFAKNGINTGGLIYLIISWFQSSFEDIKDLTTLTSSSW